MTDISKKKLTIVTQRLEELGVLVRFNEDQNIYTLGIPSDKFSSEYIEIGFLMAQFDNIQFPAEYECLSDTPSNVIPHRKGIHPSTLFVESYPQGLKYRIYFSPQIAHEEE